MLGRAWVWPLLSAHRQGESQTAVPKQQVININSEVPVTRMTLGVGSAHLGGAASQQISLTEVWLQTYPSR